VQLAPANFLIEMLTNEMSGLHCLEYTNPEFRDRVKQGFNVVMAGKGFGCGSSREQAVMALLGESATNKLLVTFFSHLVGRMWRTMRHCKIIRIHFPAQYA
jgi:hypothetical protein